MRPKTNYAKARSLEDNERLAEAIKAIKTHLPNVETEKAERFIRAFFIYEKAPQPISLKNAKKLLNELEKAAATYIGSMEEIEEHLNLQAEFSLHHIDFIEQIQNATNVKASAMELLSKLPDKTRWPQQPNPEHEMIVRLAALYEEATTTKAKEGFKHERDHETYYGPFFELVKDTFYALDVPERGGKGLGALIKRSLK